MYPTDITSSMIQQLSILLAEQVSNTTATAAEIDRVLKIADIVLPAYLALRQVGADSRTAMYLERNLPEDERGDLKRAQHYVQMLSAYRKTL